MRKSDRSFYNWLMTNRNSMAANEVQHFANNAFLDSSFPKQSSDFDELSKYLEENTTYLMSMTTFDEAWSLYNAER
ncbi:YozE family protein [Leuconostoc mesenteroides]|uniref:YozE family protein n=1 Tax=Leuconostoc mesenteroides TaxID=1245 RepID=UPI00207899FC|nr:YozE family protein [Leuconostoc mesenteroides]USI46505.1 YozE family protein [Leuconostoc mesenteroides]